jgi:hypothetical protein
MAAAHMKFRHGRAWLHTRYQGWAGGVDGNGRSAAIGKKVESRLLCGSWLLVSVVIASTTRDG